MVLNSFYQMITKRRQQVREAGNEKVHFQPQYILSILEESWLSGHGLNEFLAEDMSQYGVTVIWGKDALNMLPETTTTLIEYQSSEAATLINQNNKYVNKTSFLIIYRLLIRLLMRFSAWRTATCGSGEKMLFLKQLTFRII